MRWPLGAHASWSEALKSSAGLAPLPPPHLVRHLLLPRGLRGEVWSAAPGGGEPSAGSFPRRLHPGAGEAQGRPGGRPLSGLPRSPWAKGRGSRSWCRLPGRGREEPEPGSSVGSGLARRDPRARHGSALRGGPGGVAGLRSAGAGRHRSRLSPGQSGSGGVRRPPQVPGYRGPRTGGGRRGRAGVPVRSPTRPSVRPAGLRRSVRAAAGPGRGRRGPAQEVPPASASCPPPAARAPPRPAPRPPPPPPPL